MKMLIGHIKLRLFSRQQLTAINLNLQELAKSTSEATEFEQQPEIDKVDIQNITFIVNTQIPHSLACYSLKNKFIQRKKKINEPVM